MPNSYAMISEETNKSLISIMYSPVILAKLYTEFLNSESNCATDVHTFLQNYTRLCIQKAGMLEDTQDIDSDDFFDLVEKTNDLTKILMTVFTTGMMYGKSMFYDEFENNFGAGLEEDEDIDPSKEIF